MQEIVIREWNENNEMSLQGCFECTNWCELYDEKYDNGNVNVFASSCRILCKYANSY